MSIKKEFEEQKDKLSDGFEEKKDAIGAAVGSGVKKTKSFFRKLIMAILAFAVLGVIGYLIFANWTFSEGSRSGSLVKMSKKGVLFKTYEGQVNLGGFKTDEDSGLSGNIWEFSVKEDHVFRKLEGLEGKKVKLLYREQFRVLFWEGDTKYFIYDVEELK